MGEKKEKKPLEMQLGVVVHHYKLECHAQKLVAIFKVKVTMVKPILCEPPFVSLYVKLINPNNVWFEVHYHLQSLLQSEAVQCRRFCSADSLAIWLQCVSQSLIHIKRVKLSPNCVCVHCV